MPKLCIDQLQSVVGAWERSDVSMPSRDCPIDFFTLGTCGSCTAIYFFFRCDTDRTASCLRKNHRKEMFVCGCGFVARALASQHGDLGSIPGGFPPEFLHVVILPNDAACRRAFSRYFRFTRPCIPAPLHPRVSLHVMSGEGEHLRENEGRAIGDKRRPDFGKLMSLPAFQCSVCGEMQCHGGTKIESLWIVIDVSSTSRSLETGYVAERSRTGEETAETTENRNQYGRTRSRSQIFANASPMVRQFATSLSDIRQCTEPTKQRITLLISPSSGSYLGNNAVVGRDKGASVVQWLDYLPSTYSKRVRFPAGSRLDFHMWKLCRMMPLVGEFSQGSPVSWLFHSDPAPYSPQSPSSVLKTSLLRGAQISSFAHSLTYALAGSISFDAKIATLAHRRRDIYRQEIFARTLKSPAVVAGPHPCLAHAWCELRVVLASQSYTGKNDLTFISIVGANSNTGEPEGRQAVFRFPTSHESPKSLLGPRASNCLRPTQSSMEPTCNQMVACPHPPPPPPRTIYRSAEAFPGAICITAPQFDIYRYEVVPRRRPLYRGGGEVSARAVGQGCTGKGGGREGVPCAASLLHNTCAVTSFYPRSMWALRRIEAGDGRVRRGRIDRRRGAPLDVAGGPGPSADSRLSAAAG
ncbi:hypothetical protein PR048_023169 [Dryococelus australis]|uniref:Uncharacterized protein n=1 Tax=Dryococelus australis TaxID=614101 RepID=A0ABQ9GTF3_9NEOP|nr:hypothetical protein PR048_023169 [Dryococelus australis]